MPPPSAPAPFRHVKVPARIAGLAFDVCVPADFMPIELKEETLKFEDPSYCCPLFGAMAGYGAVVFGVAARPAFSDGSVLDWARHLAAAQNLTVESASATVLHGITAVTLDAWQESQVGVMQLKAAAFEDGGRLVLISLLSPKSIWPSVYPTLGAMLASFRLTDRKNATALLTPDAKGPQPPEEPFTPTDPRTLALADDAATLDPDSTINTNLREQGIGFVPKVLATDAARKVVTAGAIALNGTFTLPFGWHATDDGRRTLVSDREGKIQVSLNLRVAPEGADALLAEVLREHLAEQPAIDFISLDIDGTPCVAVRNLKVGTETLQQAFLAKPFYKDGAWLVARVTADDANIERAINLAEVILRDAKPLGE